MKKYVFFTMNIGGINGAEQYIFNKINYLKIHGYQVYVFSGRKSEILIHGFDPYIRLINPIFRFYPSFLNQHEREKSISWILQELDVQKDDIFIVESSNSIDALWGELIAERLHCRHFAYILHEHFRSSEAIKQFFLFKVLRHELAGIVDDSVQQMLGSLAPQPDSYSRIKAFCNNVVQECQDQFSIQLNEAADYNIGSIGRLEKDYVMPFIMNLCSYFSNNSDRHYNLVLIGGCTDKRQLNNIKNELGKCQNVHLILTGALYPVPKSLVQNMHVFISAAGSASATYYANCPSIKLDYNTGKPMGLYGYDITLNDLKKRPDKNISLEQYLDSVLIDHVQIKYQENYDEWYSNRMKEEFDRHIAIATEPINSEYYDVISIKHATLPYKLCSIICHVFGSKVAYRILESIRIMVRE